MAERLAGHWRPRALQHPEMSGASPGMARAGRGAMRTCVALLFVFAAGCGSLSDDDPAGGGGKGDEVFPETEENLGQLLVTVPSADRPLDPVEIAVVPRSGSGATQRQAVYPGEPVRVQS